MSHDFAVTPMSWRQIDSYALKIRTDFSVLDVPFFDGITFLEKVLDNALGFVRLDVEEDRLMVTAEGFTDPRGEFIQLRESVYRGAYSKKPRDRWTVHHELGHLFLHARKPMTRVPPELKSQIRPFESAEAQANRFAASLTMPAHLMRSSMTIEEVMELFGASQSAASNRLNDLFGKKGR